MKILHVIGWIAPSYGGSCKAVLEMCRELVKQGQEVTIFTTNIDGKQNLDVPLNKTVQMDGLDIRYFPVQWPRYYTVSFPLAKALRDEIPNFDIVHISSLYNFHTVVASHYCRKFNVPYLIHPHGSLDPYLTKRHSARKGIYTFLFLQRDLNHAAVIHFKTQEEMLLTKPCRIKAPGFVIPNGVNLSEFDCLPPYGIFMQKHPELSDKRILLFFSRINFKKGLDILARAFGEVAQKKDDVYLVLAGPDNEGYVAKVKTWLQQEKTLGRSIFTGMLFGEDKLPVLRDSDIFVLPSYTENFGNAVVEAMACGLPVIISNKVNIWRDVIEVNAGFVTDCDSHQVAEAILKLLDEPKLGREMGKRGKKLVEEKYTWPKAAKQMIEIYEEILKNHGTGKAGVSVA